VILTDMVMILIDRKGCLGTGGFGGIEQPASRRCACAPTYSRSSRQPGRTIRGLILLAVLALFMALTDQAKAVELCSRQSNLLMQQEGISEEKIRSLCERVRKASALIAIKIESREPELGYCRVTLSLQNNSNDFINSLTMAVEKSAFELFRFESILPGGTGYASAKSRILMACDELEEVGLGFIWPVTLKKDDKVLHGRELRRFMPVLLDSMMAWKP